MADLWDPPDWKDEQGQTWVWDPTSGSYVAGDQGGLAQKVDIGHASGGDNDLFDPTQGGDGEGHGNMFQTKNPLQEGWAGGGGSSSGTYLGSLNAPGKGEHFWMQAGGAETYWIEVWIESSSDNGVIINDAYGIPEHFTWNEWQEMIDLGAVEPTDTDPGRTAAVQDDVMGIVQSLMQVGRSGDDLIRGVASELEMGGMSYEQAFDTAIRTVQRFNQTIQQAQPYNVDYSTDDFDTSPPDEPGRFDMMGPGNNPLYSKTAEVAAEVATEDISATDLANWPTLDHEPDNTTQERWIGVEWDNGDDSGQKGIHSQSEPGTWMVAWEWLCSYLHDIDAEFHFPEVAQAFKELSGWPEGKPWSFNFADADLSYILDLESNFFGKFSRTAEAPQTVKCPNCEEEVSTDICPSCNKSLGPEWAKRDNEQLAFDSPPQHPFAGNEFTSDPIKVPRRNWMKTDDSYPSMISHVAAIDPASITPELLSADVDPSLPDTDEVPTEGLEDNILIPCAIEIGEPEREIEIIPFETPVPTREPVPEQEPERIPEPQRTPEKVPARTGSEISREIQYGWKILKVSKAGLLTSPSQGTTWEPGVAMEDITHRGEHFSFGGSEAHPGVGIYTVSQDGFGQLAHYATDNGYWALVKCSLWGKTLIHSRGFLSQYAYPYEIILVDQAPDIEKIAMKIRQRYAVDVEVRPAGSDLGFQYNFRAPGSRGGQPSQYGGLTGQAAFKAAIKDCLEQGIWPTATVVFPMLGRRQQGGSYGGSMFNGREGQWRMDVLVELGYKRVGDGANTYQHYWEAPDGTKLQPRGMMPITNSPDSVSYPYPGNYSHVIDLWNLPLRQFKP